MKRLTTDNPKDNIETALNLLYIKDHETWVRGYGPNFDDVNLFDLVRQIVKVHIPGEELPKENDDLANMMADWLDYDIYTAEGVIALLYTAAWAYAELRHKLMQYEDAAQAGRLVVLPCKGSDKLYVVGEKRIIRCDICETYLDDKKGPEYLVSFDCDSDCDGCPFNNWSQDYSGEWSCDGEYGQSAVVGSEIGKTAFLTREEAESALAQKGGTDEDSGGL